MISYDQFMVILRHIWYCKEIN